MRRLAAALLGGALLVPAAAAASNAGLETGVTHYQSAQLVEARDALGAALTDPTLQPEDRARARKYLAATYLALGDREGAKAQLSLLFLETPDAVLDPSVFVPQLVDLGESVRASLPARTPVAETAPPDPTAPPVEIQPWTEPESTPPDATASLPPAAETVPGPSAPPTARGGGAPPWVRYAVLGAGAATAVTGGVLYGGAWRTRGLLDQPSGGSTSVTWADAQAAERNASIGVGLLAVGVTLGLGAFLVPVEQGPALALAPTRDGAVVVLHFGGSSRR